MIRVPMADVDLLQRPTQSEDFSYQMVSVRQGEMSIYSTASCTPSTRVEFTPNPLCASPPLKTFICNA